jgi:hypothetical protein
MSNPTASIRRSALPPSDESADLAGESAVAAPWLRVVNDKVKTMRYGIVQIVIHDSKVVQIERTERTRFDVPQSTGQR